MDEMELRPISQSAAATGRDDDHHRFVLSSDALTTGASNRAILSIDPHDGQDDSPMSSDARLHCHRPAGSTPSAGARRHVRRLAPIVALMSLGAACAAPAPEAAPLASSAPVMTKTGSSDVVGSSGAAGALPVPPDSTGMDQQAPGGEAAGPSLHRGGGVGALPASDVAGRLDDASTHDPGIEPGPVPAEVARPAVPGRPVAVPPVVVPPVPAPPVPAPPGLIQGASAPECEPLPGPRAASWREPLPPTPRYNPAGPKRVGLQAGHWLTEQVPAELRGLGHGATGGGKMEWEVNLDLARRTKALLEAQGVEVDLLPTTVPVRYRAHLFVSIHADGDTTGRNRGFKIARPAFSSLPSDDDRLIESLYSAYGAATGLRRDDANITPRMRYYYAFNARRFCHAVAPGVPQAIVETGFLTNAADRQLLLGSPDLVARGIADGILRFLRENP